MGIAGGCMDITISGTDNLKNFVKKLKEQLQDSILEVGFLDSENATKAAQNEYGGYFKVDADYKEKALKKGVHLSDYIGIPARPFMQNSIKSYASAWGKQLAAQIPEQEYNIKKALGILGTRMVADVKNTIKDGSYIENSPQTIKIKGFDKPLIDTGAMLNAVTYEIKS